MLRVLHRPVAADEFKESEHPRGASGTSKGGQFVAKGEGGGSAKPKKSPGALAEGQWVVQYALGQVLKKHGYKKVKSSEFGNNVRVFENDKGQRITVHPPETGTGYSGKWTVHYSGGGTHGKGSSGLEEKIKELHKSVPAEAPKEEPKKEPEKGLFADSFDVLKKAGYKPTVHGHPGTSSESWIMKSSDGKTFVQLHANGEWIITAYSGMVKTGISPIMLSAQIKSIEETGKLEPFAPVTPQPKIETPITTGEMLPATKDAYSAVLADNGYEPDASNPTLTKFVNIINEDKLATVVLTTSGPQVGNWTSTSPGHLTKEGHGIDALKALMEGKSGDYKNVATTPAPHPPVKKEEKKHVQLHKELQNAHKAPLSTQAAAVNSYKGAGYKAINDCLRTKANCNDPQVDRITEWLNENELPKDIQVYRGIPAGAYATFLKSIAFTGAKFKDKGFLSTSTNPGFSQVWAEGSLFLTINAPKGAKAATIKGKNEYDNEYEVLFQRNTIFEVDDYDETTGHMTLTIVAQQPVGKQKQKEAA